MKPDNQMIVDSLTSKYFEADTQRAWSEQNYERAANMAMGIRPDYIEAGEDQTTIVLPEAEDFLRSLAGGVKSAIMNAMPFPDLECQSNDVNMKAATEAFSKILRYEINEGKLWSILKAGVYRAGISGYNPTKVYWYTKSHVISDNGETEEVGGLCFENIEPNNFWLDPSGRNEYYIERKEIHYAELKTRAKEWKYTNIAEVKPGEIFMNNTVPFEVLENIDPTSTRDRDMVELLVFCGKLHDKEGNLLCENGHAVIASGNVLIKPPTEYEYFHRETPYAVMNPLNLIQAGYPKAILWGIMDLIDAVSDLFNLTLKHAYMSLPIVSYYGGAIASDPEEILDGVFPGATVELAMPGAHDAINVTSANNNPFQLVQILQYAQQQLQTRVAGLVQAGLPSGRGRQSATEIVAAQNLASGLIVDLLDGISETWIAPLCRKAMYLIAQYRPIEEWRQPHWKWLLGSNYEPFMEMVENHGLLNALNLMKLKIEEPVESIRRRTTAESLMALFKLFAASGPGYLNMPVLMKDIARKMGIDPQEYITDEINWNLAGLSLANNGMLGQLNDIVQRQQGGMPQGAPQDGQMMQGMPQGGNPGY